MEKFKILWIDDEVDLLKPHILFLENKGFQVFTSTNGSDALKMIQFELFDIVFLDENMPGLTGLETLSKIKEISNVPVVMITKSEEEYLMEDAIGAKIADYLIKPVNPHQILSTIKKKLDTNRLVYNKAQKDYREGYAKISDAINSASNHDDWVEVYKKIIQWEIKFDNLNDNAIKDVLLMQKQQANIQFFKYIKDHYISWFSSSNKEKPSFSDSIFRERVIPIIKEKPVFFILIDNLRLDQWLIIKPLLEVYYNIQNESTYYSILPTATQYSRNALFSGLMPIDIQKKFPDYWVDENEDGGKNLYEEKLVKSLIEDVKSDCKISFNKILNLNSGKKILNNLNDLMLNDLNIIIYNFVDILSHAKTELKMIKELVDDDKSYRDLTITWFKNSPLFDFLQKIAHKNVDVVITTDHGTINVNQPIKIIGEKDISSNLRYKKGRRMNFNSKDVFFVNNPEKIKLPSTNLSSLYVFAGTDKFFAYPNNYNHYVNYYKNTYQHGGISMEEMIIPFVHLSSKFL